VGLTFDDGPHPDFTSTLLDLLAQLDLRATFFCVGKNAQQHPELVQRILEEGHGLGSHSMTHRHPAQLSNREVYDDYRRGRAAVCEAAGRDVRAFRPPHGHLSFAHGATMRALRLEPWMWTVDPEDWVPGADRDELVARAGTATSSDVVLFHDWIEEPLAPAALDRSATLAAVPEVVAAIRGRGLTFDRVDR
jgi:chitooligosaccharide deacetylase